MKVAQRCLRFIPYYSEDLALADKKLFSILRYASCTKADTHKALTALRNNFFKNIFALESLKQHPGTGNRASASINRSSYLFIF